MNLNLYKELSMLTRFSAEFFGLAPTNTTSATSPWKKKNYFASSNKSIFVVPIFGPLFMKFSRILSTYINPILFNQVSYLLRILDKVPLQEWIQEFGAVNFLLVDSGIGEDIELSFILMTAH